MHFKFFVQFVALAALLPFFVVSQPNQAVAQARCEVTDPTGTPLNVRRSPNGQVIGRLRNGTIVGIQRMGRDNRGRPWAFVVRRLDGSWRRVGWVWREFISCF